VGLDPDGHDEQEIEEGAVYTKENLGPGRTPGRIARLILAILPPSSAKCDDADSKKHVTGSGSAPLSQHPTAFRDEAFSGQAAAVQFVLSATN